MINFSFFCLLLNISEPRHKAMAHGLINKQREPFSIRKKGFWDLDQAKKLLEPKFIKGLGHEPDGLIFQPSKDVCAIHSLHLKYENILINFAFLFLALYSRSM